MATKISTGRSDRITDVSAGALAADAEGVAKAAGDTPVVQDVNKLAAAGDDASTPPVANATPSVEGQEAPASMPEQGMGSQGWALEEGLDKVLDGDVPVAKTALDAQDVAELRNIASWIDFTWREVWSGPRDLFADNAAGDEFFNFHRLGFWSRDSFADTRSLIEVEKVSSPVATIPPIPSLLTRGTVFGTPGQDRIDAAKTGYESVVIYGLGDNDVLTANGNDTLYGEDGDDTLYASGGNNVLIGGAGADSIHGSERADVFYLDSLDHTDVQYATQYNGLPWRGLWYGADYPAYQMVDFGVNGVEDGDTIYFTEPFYLHPDYPRYDSVDPLPEIQDYFVVLGNGMAETLSDPDYPTERITVSFEHASYSGIGTGIDLNLTENVLTEGRYFGYYFSTSESALWNEAPVFDDQGGLTLLPYKTSGGIGPHMYGMYLRDSAVRVDEIGPAVNVFIGSPYDDNALLGGGGYRNEPDRFDEIIDHTLYGGGGGDTLVSRWGNDSFFLDTSYGYDRAYGGPGMDTLFLTGMSGQDRPAEPGNIFYENFLNLVERATPYLKPGQELEPIHYLAGIKSIEIIDMKYDTDGQNVFVTPEFVDNASWPYIYNPELPYGDGTELQLAQIFKQNTISGQEYSLEYGVDVKTDEHFGGFTFQDLEFEADRSGFLIDPLRTYATGWPSGTDIMVNDFDSLTYMENYNVLRIDGDSNDTVTLGAGTDFTGWASDPWGETIEGFAINTVDYGKRVFSQNPINFNHPQKSVMYGVPDQIYDLDQYQNEFRTLIDGYTYDMFFGTMDGFTTPYNGQWFKLNDAWQSQVRVDYNYNGQYQPMSLLEFEQQTGEDYDAYVSVSYSLDIDRTPEIAQVCMLIVDADVQVQLATENKVFYGAAYSLLGEAWWGS